MSPPPPTGTTTVRPSASCPAISSPTVPRPAPSYVVRHTAYGGISPPQLERPDRLQALELQVGVEGLDEAQGRADRHAGEPRGRLPDVLGGDHAIFSSSSAAASPLPGPSWPWRAPAGHRRRPHRHRPLRLPSRPAPRPPPDRPAR